MKPIDMTGAQFGTVTVGKCLGRKGSQRVYAVHCAACGATREVAGGNIRRAQASGTAGCPCTTRARRHGLWGHPLYGTWEGMVRRCTNPKHVHFKNYGGRGITVCSEWADDPRAFVDWALAEGWRPGLQIDRVNNDDDYSPKNCRIVTQFVNGNNRRNNRRLSVDGREYTIAEASRFFGLNKTTIKERLNRGWSDADAVRAVTR